MFTRSHYRDILVPPLPASKIFISPLGRCPFPAPTGRNAKAQGIALGMFRKISAKPCRGETQAVKFQAQVLGQKGILLFRPYRACHCFLRPKPRASPWAFAFRPVGAGKALFIAWPPAWPSASIADTHSWVRQLNASCGWPPVQRPHHSKPQRCDMKWRPFRAWKCFRT